MSNCITSGTSSLGGILNIPTTTVSQLLQTDGFKNVVSMGVTLPTAVQDNITRLGTISNVGTPISSSMIGSLLAGKTLTTANLTNPTFTSLGGALGGANVLATLSGGQIIERDLLFGVNKILVAEGGTNSNTALVGSSIMVSNAIGIVQGSAGTSTTVLHGNIGGVPTYSAVLLSADVTGLLASANIATTLSSKVMAGCATSGTTSLSGTVNLSTGTASQMLQLDVSKNIVSSNTIPIFAENFINFTNISTGNVLPANGCTGLSAPIANGQFLIGS